MKYPKLIALITLFIGLTVNSLAQKLSPGDLIGQWDGTDSSQQSPPGLFHFIDGSHLTFSILGKTAAQLNYNIDTSGNVAALIISGVSEMKIKIHDTWLVKKVNDNTLKVQMQLLFAPGLRSDEINKPIKWDDNETFKNTIILTRKRD